MEVSLAELMKYAIEGANAKVLLLMNAACFVGARWSLVSRKVAVAMSMLVGGFLTAFGAYAEALEKEGTSATALTNSAITGFFLGMGASSILGWIVSFALDKSGVWPISITKRYNEALLDPRDPTLPEGAKPVPEPVDDAMLHGKGGS